jgi:hypothetical protein
MRVAVVASFLGAILAVAACGQKSDSNKTVTISGNNGKVTISGNSQQMTMKSDDGKTTVEYNTDGLGHADMPAFAPLYPGAKVLSSVASAGNGGKGAMVAFTVAAAPSDIVAFYKQKASAAGLVETLNATEAGGMTFMASKDKMMVEVIATKSADGAQVQVIWSNGA